MRSADRAKGRVGVLLNGSWRYAAATGIDRLLALWFWQHLARTAQQRPSLCVQLHRRVGSYHNERRSRLLR